MNAARRGHARVVAVTFQTAVTFAGADQSQGWKCDTSKGKRTFPPEASISDFLQHHGCDAAHIQAFLFLDADGSISAPTASVQLLIQIHQEVDQPEVDQPEVVQPEVVQPEVNQETLQNLDPDARAPCSEEAAVRTFRWRCCRGGSPNRMRKWEN